MRYAIPSLSLYELETDTDVLDCLERFKNIKPKFQEEMAKELYQECIERNIPIDSNSLIWRFVDCKQEALDKATVLSLSLYYIAKTNELDKLCISDNTDILEKVSDTIKKAIDISDVFKEHVMLNPPKNSQATMFNSYLYTVGRNEQGEMLLFLIGLIEVKYYNLQVYEYEIKETFNFDRDNIVTVLDESSNNISLSDYGIPELKKYPMYDKEHVLLAIKFFNYYVGTKYEQELANNINNKIQEHKILDKEIHMTDKNKFKQYYIPYNPKPPKKEAGLAVGYNYGNPMGKNDVELSYEKLLANLGIKDTIITENNNALLNEAYLSKSKTIGGLERIDLNAKMFERYINELVGVPNTTKWNDNMRGILLLNKDKSVMAFILCNSVLDYLDDKNRKKIIKLNIPTTAITNFYVSKEVPRNREEYFQPLFNICMNRYSVEMVVLDKKDTETLEWLKKINFLVIKELDNYYFLGTKYLANEYVPLLETSNFKNESSLNKYGSDVGVYDKLGLWNPIVEIEGKAYRERCEALIFNDNNEVLMSINMNRYKIAGGGTHKESLIEEQLINECREEVRVNIKDIQYIGTYQNDFTDVHMEQYKGSLENVTYYGSITYLYTSKYDSKYTGEIKYVDRDDLLNTSKFYPVNYVLSKSIKPEWIVGIISRLRLTSGYYDTLFNKASLKTSFLYLVNNNESYGIDTLSTISLSESTNPSVDIISSNKRKKMESVIYGYYGLIDGTGKNLQKYKDLYSKMDDKQFTSYMKKFLNDKKQNFFLEILPNVNEPNLKKIKESADFLNIPLDEYIYYRHDGDKDVPVRSPYKVPKGKLILRRLQQTLSKKNTYSFNIDSRSHKTGALTGGDKVARITDMETYQLTAIGADATLQEFMSARADNMANKMAMNKQISLYGYTYLKDLPNDEKGQALKTTSIFFKAAGLDSDL